mmetsp:Transcript_6149/g.17193  ORF Transcript_6149/g.17193 Transcript_6149/m.17193 type:complete len:455 (+) Transcript_6149:70-1434(+)
MAAMESELRCPVCNDFFNDPVMLQCTHHLCQAHVEKHAERGQLKCPVCGDSTVLPSGGDLRIDRVLQLVVDIWREKQQEPPPRNGEGSPARPPPICGFCEEKPATRRCVQCDGVLCDTCERTSHSKGFFKSHNVVDLGGVSASGVGLDDYGRRMLCDEHRDEKLSFYCLDCRKPVCSHCLILGEHKGHNQTPVDQAFITAKDTLDAWVAKLRERCTSAESLLEQLRNAEFEVQRGAEGQRKVINEELDHLREMIETKRHQLLSKSAMEEKQKRVHLQAQIDRAEGVRGDSARLVARSKDLLSLPSEHAFLAIVLPLIQDMKKCAGQPLDAAPQVTSNFRPLSCEAQVRSLGDLDLGHPRQPQVQSAAMSSYIGGHSPSVIIQQQIGLASDASTVPPNYSVLPPSYQPAHATVSYLPQAAPQQPQQAQAPQHQLMGAAGGMAAPSVYVYRSVHAP